MTKLPVVSGRETVKRLKKLGFIEVRQKGSHIILRGSDPPVTISVPDHKELKPGTLRSILKVAGVKKEEFIDLK
jgi:predicted RNA binding protein YcfA (HicA-like mRNA interferase family)